MLSFFRERKMTTAGASGVATLMLSAFLMVPSVVAGKTGIFLMPVSIDGKGGYIDQTGKIIIKPQFDEVRAFSEGLAAVLIGSKWGYIDESGGLVVPPQFNRADGFSEGLAVVLTDTGGYGFIDRRGSFAIPAKFDAAYTFSEGLARVSIGRKTKPLTSWSWPEAGLPAQWMFVDRQGKVAFRPDFDYVDDFHGGFALVAQRSDGRCLMSFINKSGRLAFDEWFTVGNDFSEGVAVVSKDPKGIMDFHFGRLILDNFDLTSSLSLAVKHIDFFLIDADGNKIPMGPFQNLWSFSDGLAAVQLNDKWGYLNKSGKMVLETKFDAVRDFSEGLAFVSDGEKRYYIDKSGRRLFDAKGYALMRGYANGVAAITECSGGVCKDGYIDKTGHIIWKPSR